MSQHYAEQVDQWAVGRWRGSEHAAACGVMIEKESAKMLAPRANTWI